MPGDIEVKEMETLKIKEADLRRKRTKENSFSRSLLST
jgi:hypothetical protein